jgi:DNA polymerase I-like protein with 3'-5' exonuclease and polymerase domains
MDNLILVDGNSLINRAYYAFGGRGEAGELSFGGMPTNAVYGFLNMFIKAVTDLKSKYAAVAFDVRAKTFRHKMFTQYKAGRHKTPDDLITQIISLKSLLKTMNVKIYECEGYEADDIIGTVSKQAGNKIKTIILSADRDGLQLVTDNCELHLTKTGVTNTDIWNEARIQKEFGIAPRQLIDVKALMGDKSDNIPGAFGIGEKTALSLIQTHGNIAEVLKNSANPKIVNSKDMIILSRALAEINCSVPINFNLEETRFVFPFSEDVYKAYEKLGFKSLLRRNIWEESVSKNTPQNTPAAKIEIKSSEAYQKIDEEVIPVLQKMQNAGLKVDLWGLFRLGDKLEGEINEIADEIYKLAGGKFNINSPKVLGEMLTEIIGQKLKSTDEDTLTKYRNEFPIVELVLQYRQKFKLNSTYVKGYQAHLDNNNFLHTTLNIDKTATGRLSSSEPNLQNIPIRRANSDEFRQIFVSRFDNGKILSADYSQIELRLLANFSGDKNLIAAFNRGADIHTETAALVFGVAQDQVDKNMRRKAKAVNFGIIYGISSFGLSRDLSVPFHEAAAIINNYFAAFPRVKEYLDECVAFAKTNGFAQTMFGRRRPMPELLSNNHNVVAFAERASMNMPMQGTSADIIKMAMVNIDKEMTEKKLSSVMTLQIHDELVFDCPDGEVRIMKELVKRNMENIVKLSVPLTVDISCDIHL